MQSNQNIVSTSNAKQKRVITISYPTAVLIMIIALALAFVIGTRAHKLPMFGDVTTNEDFSSLNETYATLERLYDGDIDKSKLIDGAKHGMVDALGDPHTMYLNQAESADFTGDLNGQFEGIGAELGKVDGVLTILGVLNDSPAKKTGIRVKDMILRVNDEETVGLTVGQVVAKIRGPKDTSVRLTIVRDGQTQEVTVVRGVVTSPSVTSEIIENGKIGYLRVSRFGDDTPAAARAEAVRLKEQGVESILLDLRGNAGGYVNAAEELAGLWLESKVVATERRGGEIQQTFTTGNDAPLADMKTVVLVDGGSASASEILAAALSEHGAAKLVGTMTYGKGTMQVPETLRDGGTLKVTVAKWHTSKGTNVDGKGLKPDVVVEPGDNELSTGLDVQKSTAIQELLK